MSKRARLMIVGLVAAVPFLASACKVDIGNGCQLLIAEPGAKLGVVCN
jgi:hypothetical protein